MTAKILETVFKNVDSKLLTEEVKTEAEQLIKETIDARVDAKTLELKESYENKEKELKESYEIKEQNLNKKTEENEKILIEEAQKYKKELEQAVIEETKEYKERVEKELAEESTKYREDIESMVLTEAKELKARQDTALVEEVKKFKDEMVDKVSDYIEAQLNESIPSEIMEAVARLEVYEPLVESVRNAFASNFIKLDDTSYQLIKEARSEIETLKAEVQNKTKEEIQLKKEMKNVKRNMKVESLTEGLTPVQKNRAVKLLEGVDLEEIDSRFDKIRDIIIEEKVAPSNKKVAESKKVQKLSESKKKKANDKKEPEEVDENDEVVKHQVKKVINESEAKKLLKEDESKVSEKTNPRISAWKNKLDKQRNRN